MASITEIKGKFRAQIRRAGHPSVASTFDSRAEAEKWVTLQEAEIIKGNKIGKQGKSGIKFTDAIDKYIEVKGDLSKTYITMLRKIQRVMGHLMVDKMTDEDIVKYIREKSSGPVTNKMHLGVIGQVLQMCRHGWKYHVQHDIMKIAYTQLKMLKLVGSSPARDRRPTNEEIAMLCAHPWPSKIPMAEIIMFAIHSAMRQSEITRIRWADFDEIDMTTRITDRKDPRAKKGNNCTVPLLAEAIEIIKRQPRTGSQFVFPYSAHTISCLFSAEVPKMGIENLHFHDLRHEGASRLFEMGYQIPQVALFTGHKTWSQLARYTQLKAKDLRRPGAPKGELRAVPDPAKVGTSTEIDEAEYKEFLQFKAMKKLMEQQQAA
jgi:site-specific recombinase XerD